ncbi:MAG: metal ABC transporter substrate-binding protein [Clostridia bacterium]|nr:metal ABC transporter substrate-binding protein [Clostridia bacterium]
MKSNLVKTACLVLVIGLVFAVGCSKQTSEDVKANHDGKLSVHTSFYTMADFAAKIGGDKIKITNLVPSGTEPHDWEPAPKDIASLEKADVFIYNGAGMEGWVEKILGSINNEKTTVLEASKGLKLLENADKDEGLQYDPHVWLNPALAKKQLEAIKNTFVSVDSANKSYYEKNYNEYILKFDELDKEYNQTVASFSKKDLVVAHEAFGYLCNAYGLKQVAIEGLGAESEPTPARMAEISKFAKENEVKVIFFEELISPKIAETIASEVGAATDVLNPLEGLSDEQVKAGKEYLSVMRDNLKALERALK